ncbi:hypothetical protein [Deinococcus roseus]|uniref:Uncharacterized protein n=1 Tax=Deinococcus roseus TaxID=392414 RepID=A0ABQ2D8C8_9DEIO|nr:hypothetical protein [Deinococcus roseus]GGJ48140.1 hypothetical protein GCM10008938_37710 [Deinococcus roseus]
MNNPTPAIPPLESTSIHEPVQTWDVNDNPEMLGMQPMQLFAVIFTMLLSMMLMKSANSPTLLFLAVEIGLWRVGTLTFWHYNKRFPVGYFENWVFGIFLQTEYYHTTNDADHLPVCAEVYDAEK